MPPVPAFLGGLSGLFCGALTLAACTEPRPLESGATARPAVTAAALGKAVPAAEAPAAGTSAPAATAAQAPAEGAPSADALRKATAECKQVSEGLFKLDRKGDESVPVCGREGAVFWTADLDVDCDGRESDKCNKKADPDYQAETAAHDSHGEPLDAAAVPYVVVPAPSERWSYKSAGLRAGRSVVAVIHGDRVAYGVIGDVGPKALLGEASYAMAERLGLDPDPRRGGAAKGVVYVAFTGEGGEVKKPEDAAEVQRVGERMARRLLVSR